MKDDSMVRLNSTLTFLSRVNENLLKIEKEKEIFEKVPKIIEDIGGYIVCILSIEGDFLIPQYPESEFGKKIYINDIPETSPFKRIMEIKEPIVIIGPENIIKECSSIFSDYMLNKIIEKEIDSAIFFPMHYKDGWIGIFLLFTPQSEEEFRILKDLSDNLSYAIYSLKMREENKKIREAYEIIFKISPVGLVEVDFSEIKDFMRKFSTKDFNFLSEEDYFKFCEDFMEKFKILRMNEEVYKIFELEDKNNLEKAKLEFIKDNLEILKENLPYIFPLPYEEEITVYTLKKNKRILRLRAVPFPGYEEDLSHVIFVLMDITEEKESIQRVNKILNQVVETLAEMVEKRDPYTAGHQKKVAELAISIGRKMGLSEERLNSLYIAGLLHDVGKISIPTDILNKPGKLDSIEFEFIKKHPEIGYELLKNIEFPYPVIDIILQHHERIDGSGYPKGLKDGEILLEARILAVSDVVEAMTSHRPYRPAFPLETALKEISEKKGILYDSNVVEACIEVLKGDFRKNF